MPKALQLPPQTRGEMAHFSTGADNLEEEASSALKRWFPDGKRSGNLYRQMHL